MRPLEPGTLGKAASVVRLTERQYDIFVIILRVLLIIQGSSAIIEDLLSIRWVSRNGHYAAILDSGYKVKWVG